MAGCWFDPLRRLSEEALRAAPAPYPTDVVLFYLARWCQKEAGVREPDIGSFDRSKLGAVAMRIARHLGSDGPFVERFVRRDFEAVAELRAQLLESARHRARHAAEDCVHDAIEKIAKVLLTGTAPSEAAERLREGPEGPANEYVFSSPFPYWARRVAINLMNDALRREARARRPRQPRKRTEIPRLDRDLLARACASLPGLLQAMRELPPKQRSVVSLSLQRTDLDEDVREQLYELAPDLFSEPSGAVITSDDDIARLLGTTRRLVAANRSAARRKLVGRDPIWGFALDVLMPHRSTRRVEVEADA